MRLFAHIALLISFFTRLPVPSCLFKKDVSLTDVIWGVPLVGALLGMIVCGCMSLCLYIGLPFSLVVLIGLGSGILLSGALHEDGLADFCDGLGVRGKDRILAVMHDSSIGSYGVLALIFTLIWRAVALFELMRAGSVSVDFGWFGMAGLTIGIGPLGAFLMYIGGRGLMVPLMLLPLASKSGLAFDGFKKNGCHGRSFIVLGQVLIALLITFAIFVWVLPLALGQILLLLLSGGFFAFAMGLIAIRRLGGVSGDVYGAAEQGAEMGIVGALVFFMAG